MQVRRLSEAERAIVGEWRYPGRLSTYELGGPVAPQRPLMAVEHGDELIGYCCFDEEARVPGVEPEEGSLDVGYGLRPDLVGRGLGREFVAAILDYAEAEFEPARLRLVIVDWNATSRRLAEVLGFSERVGVVNDQGRFLELVRPVENPEP